MVERERRAESLSSLGEYGLSISPPSPESGAWPEEGHSAPFCAFCRRSYEHTAGVIQKVIDATS